MNTITFNATVSTFKGKKNKEFPVLDIVIHPEHTKRAFIDASVAVLLKVLGKTQLTGILATGIGKDNGLPYRCLDFKITDDTTTKIFLDSAELALIDIQFPDSKPAPAAAQPAPQQTDMPF